MTRKVVTLENGCFVHVDEIRDRMNQDEKIKYTKEHIIQIAQSIAQQDITSLIHYPVNGERYIQRIEREELVDYIKREHIMTPDPLLQMQHAMQNIFQGKMIIRNYHHS